MSEATSEVLAATANEAVMPQARASASPQPATALFNKLQGGPGPAGSAHDIDIVLDIPVQITVELGRTRIAIRSILQLAQGSVIELDGAAGEPLNVLVNGCLIAQGEVVTVNGKLGIRLTDIVTPSERMRKLQP